MRTSSYRALLAIPAVRQVLVLRFFIGTPFFAANVILVLHVVGHLERTYTEAGLVSAVYAVALTVSNPWRGRLLDRIGLRRTLGPSILVMAACWALAPWVPYPVLLPLVFVAGLFVVPMSVVRLVLMAHAGTARRTAALSMDSVVVESTFMLGPVLGVLAATSLPTPWVLLGAQLMVVAGATWLWLADPSFAVDDDEHAALPPRRHRLALPLWVSSGVVGVLLVAVASTVVLYTEDLGTVAALREAGRAPAIGWVLALWGFSSLLGGLAYGMLRRHPPSWVLIALLAASTMLVAAADGFVWFVLLLFVSGFFCAPTITATTDDLARLVPAGIRGEAMGWHQSAMTLGGAVGAPVAGAAIDAAGWHGGFLLGGGIGLVIAVVAALTYRRVPTPPTGSDARDAVAVGGLAHGVGHGGADPRVER